MGTMCLTEPQCGTDLGLIKSSAVPKDDYFILNGIDKDRISVKSYGEERPVAFGQDEKSYSKNRRVEIN